MRLSYLLVVMLVLLLQWPTSASSQSLRPMRETSRSDAAVRVEPPSVTVQRELAYGTHTRQRFDVYLPASARNAPVILFVHGGGWAFGDKGGRGVIENKAAYWLAKGYVVVSTNYRLRPEAAPLEQARDVAFALARVQKLAPQWQADPSRVVLMGHSSGAHLVALVGASSVLWRQAGARPPVGVVSLDTAALDVPQAMAKPALPGLYARAFGDGEADWVAASPYHQLTADGVPMLAVCSSRRREVCAQGQAFQRKAATMGVRVEVLPQDLSHRQVNQELGLPSAYTDAVDRFIDALVK